MPATYMWSRDVLYRWWQNGVYYGWDNPNDDYYVGLIRETNPQNWDAENSFGEVGLSGSAAPSYSRLYVGRSSGPAPNTYQIYNANLIYNNMAWSWPTATESWGTIYCLSFMTIGTLYSGSRLFYAPLDSPVFVDTGDTFTIPQNGFQFRAKDDGFWLSL